MAPRDDNTVRIRPPSVSELAVQPRKSSRRGFLICAACAGAAAASGGVGWWLFGSRKAPPAKPASKIVIRTAGEQAICDNHPTDLDVFRFDKNPRIVVLDFASLARQGAMLNRVAAMSEKIGIRHDQALDDVALDAAIRAGGDTPDTFYYGHDYGAVELRSFFAATDRQNLKLTSDELWLRKLLDQDGGLNASDSIGLISIPAVDEGGVTTDMRSTILHHELSHGEFFTNPAYEAWTTQYWAKTLDGPTRDAFRKFLVSENYDSGIESLMANETQAYLMFTPSPDFFRPDLVGLDETTIKNLRRQFREGMPPGWLRDVAMREAR